MKVLKARSQPPEHKASTQGGVVVLSVEKFILMLNSEKFHQQSYFMMILSDYYDQHQNCMHEVK